MVQPILDETDLESINEALELAVRVEEDITRAEQAGIDVTGAKERLAATTARLHKIKTAFFPNQ